MGIGDELDGAGVSYFVVVVGLCCCGYETKHEFQINAFYPTYSKGTAFR